jgi:plastocyanin
MSIPANRLHTLSLAAWLCIATVAGCSGGGGKSTAPAGGGSNSGGELFDLGPFALGQSAQLTFVNASTIPYHCNSHRSEGMTGTVQVDASGADSLLVQIGAGGDRFVPALAHVRPGGHVRWVNVSNMTNHTVTSD